MSLDFNQSAPNPVYIFVELGCLLVQFDPSLTLSLHLPACVSLVFHCGLDTLDSFLLFVPGFLIEASVWLELIIYLPRRNQDIILRAKDARGFLAFLWLLDRLMLLKLLVSVKVL